MIKYPLYIVAILLTVSVRSAASNELDHLRKSFHQAVFHPEMVPQYTQVIEGYKKSTSTLIKAYMAADMALRARESWNPVIKLNYLTKYRELINEAVELDKKNLEIRFLRYAIEFNLPKIFRSLNSMEEDKKSITSGIHEIEYFEVEQSFILYIVQLFKDTGSWSESEIELIESKIVGRSISFVSGG